MRKKTNSSSENLLKLTERNKSNITITLTNPLVFTHVCDYLDRYNLMTLMAVSKDINKAGNIYFKTLLTRKNLPIRSHLYVNQDADLIRYNLEYRFHYCRDLLVNFLAYPNPVERDSKNPMNVKIYKKLNGKNFSKFAIGYRFSAFLTNENELYILKTEKMLDPVAKPEYMLRQNVKKFSANAQNMVYLTYDGQVHIIFYDEQAETTDLFEDTIDITKTNPIDDMEVSFMYILMIGELIT